ncbi:zinc finger protein 644-like [Salarias fasciatus]|uniref:zinc finger protein 644-like n=1 Tax=Salarias fasciatus TaxID=181472 RepID=UPI0011769870|nr:zinc finger protein 644-like [Salarias fasciatus]
MSTASSLRHISLRISHFSYLFLRVARHMRNDSEESLSASSDPKTNAQVHKDVECASDSPGRAQEPLQSHTSSLKNNAAGLSSDEHENPLNGTQPNPFVYSSVPAVPRAGNSLPSGTLVNGPGSHPTSEVHRVLNKGAVLSDSVPDATWHAEKDTSPEVSPPPGELQSDAWKRTARPVAKTPATQPGVNMPLSHMEEKELKLARSAPSPDGARRTHISQPLTKQTIKTSSRWDVEYSGSPSDDYDNAKANGGDSARGCVLHHDRRPETDVMHQGDDGHGSKGTADCREKHNFSTHAGNVDSGNKDESVRIQADIKYAVMPFRDLSRNIASDCVCRIYSTAQEGCNEENDPEDESNVSPKVEQLETEQLERDPLFFSCTICNVNFKEKRHFHRHMMYHLGQHNQVNSEKLSQPFVCRQCGRLFCDSGSLVRHIVIHRDRLEQLVGEIKCLKKGKFGGRNAAVECATRGSACNCPKILVQRAKVQNNVKHYYFCQECNFMTLTQQTLEDHLLLEHLDTHQAQAPGDAVKNVTSDGEKGFCLSGGKVERHSDESFVSHKKFAGLKFNLVEEQICFSRFSHKKEEKHVEKSADKTLNSPKFSLTEPTLSPSSWRIDRYGRLLLQPVKKLDVATDLTCAGEDAENNDHEAFGSSKRAHCPTSADISLSARKLKLDQMLSRGSKNDLAIGDLPAQANKNYPSMSSVSTPSHKAPKNLNGKILPRLSQRLKKQCAVRELERGCEGGDNLSDCTSEATGGFLESSENERNPYTLRYFRKRQSFSAQYQSPHALKDEDDGDEDCSDVEQLTIKEEYEEAAACDESSESCGTPPGDVLQTPGEEQKPCPYCPAKFKSGVGLSNHVRGHLHRAGLSYNARHVVSPEQVALRDHRQRDHRQRVHRRISTGEIKKAVTTESQGEHKCPLCWCWFETKTGLSNHVRGHLKHVGKRAISSSTGSKSPLCILNQLLKDKKEHRNILQVLNKSHAASRLSASQKLGGGSFLSQTDVPVKSPRGVSGPLPALDSFVPKQEEDALAEWKTLPVDAQRESTLVELLKTEQVRVKLGATSNQQTHVNKMMCAMTQNCVEEASADPSWMHGGLDSGKVWVECSGTSPSSPRLRAQLQAYAHRKRMAAFQHPGYDYVKKKARPRPGLKEKILPPLNTEIHTFTCRFCDLIFQGPSSVQEDWIKHLQRHLLHSTVPHSGSRMVEVLGLHPRQHV